MRKKILFVFVLIYVFSFYNFVFSDVNINEVVDLNSQIIIEDTQEDLFNNNVVIDNFLNINANIAANVMPRKYINISIVAWLLGKKAEISNT